MKKSVVVLLLLSTLLVGCVHQNKSFADPASHEGEYTDSDIENSTSHEEEYDSSYMDIECYPSKNYGTFLVGSQDDADVLSLQLPISWILTKKNSSFVVSNERGEIGKIFFGVAQDTALWKPACEEEHKTTATVSVSKIIEKQVNGSDFRHRFTFTYQSNNGERTITLTVNYIEADSSAQNNILSKVKTKQVRTDPKIGIISAPTAKKSVLILGNSFINSSKIGNILQEMCSKNGKICSVTAYSRGYANIGTYSNDASIINSIKAKNYGAVFICGCYDNQTEQVNNYGTLKAACDTAGIPLILFPAHNESSDIIHAIRTKYADDLFLDWREEINTLISKKGISTSKFCIDDMHKHSTPLAGYVGAHMIYRAIFGELPQKYQSSYFDATSYYATLGDYVTNPSVLTETKASIYYLS
ncbi:MAG: hypothetical protein II955_04210 [Clostridia bacterium]|nr:hypothetical protein [Clostridia bacterium]